MELMTPIKIGPVEIKNRMVKSATHESMAGPNGEVTEEVIRFYRRLAAGGVGLIISGNIFHDWAGHNWPLQLGLDNDGLIEGHQRLTSAVHEEGGTIFAQINDCGREASAAYSRGLHPRGPSAMPHTLFFHIPRAMTKDQIRETIASFAAACARAKTAGYDGVQIHGAHGYLVNQFLSPLMNRRKDEYGGPLENRWRFVQELYHAVRDTVGPDYPVTIKMNATDSYPLPLGIRPKESVRTAKMLADLGLDALEVSCGCYEAGMTLIRGPLPVRLALRTARELATLPAPIKGLVWLTEPVAMRLFPFRENYNIEYAREIKKLVKVPVMSIGGIRDPEQMERFIREGWTDMVSLARPLICEPNFPRRIAEGDLSPSSCVNCNICLMHIQVKGLRCYRGKMPPPEKYW